MKRYYFILKEGAHQSSIDHPHNGLNPVGMKGTQKSSITIHKNVNSHRMAYKIQQCKKRGNSKALILRSLNIPKLYVMKLRRLFSPRFGTREYIFAQGWAAGCDINFVFRFFFSIIRRTNIRIVRHFSN